MYIYLLVVFIQDISTFHPVISVGHTCLQSWFGSPLSPCIQFIRLRIRPRGYPANGPPANRFTSNRSRMQHLGWPKPTPGTTKKPSDGSLHWTEYQQSSSSEEGGKFLWPKSVPWKQKTALPHGPHLIHDGTIEYIKSFDYCTSAAKKLERKRSTWRPNASPWLDCRQARCQPPFIHWK